MLTLPEDTQVTTRNETGMGFSVIENMITGLRQNVYADFGVNVKADRKISNVFVMSQDLYSDAQCDYEWYEIIKSLRVADDDIHHLRFTNTYVEQRISGFSEELKEIKNTSESMVDQLNELTKIDVEFSRIVFNHLSQIVQNDSKKDGKNVRFKNKPRKSKSAEYSIHKMCSSCGLVREKKNTIPPRKDKSRRKKNYGKYCSSCGAIEVSSQNSMVRCRDCNGEIIIQGICSSCDSFKTKTRQLQNTKKYVGKMDDKSCSTCEMLKRTRICWDDKDRCNRCKKRKIKVTMENFNNDNNKQSSSEKFKNYMEESSFCSDCEYTSSCDVLVPDHKNYSSNRGPSLESVIPLSDSDQATFNLQDNDASCSISSSGTEIQNGCDRALMEQMVSVFETPLPIHSQTLEAVEVILSTEEEFDTPRESLSVEEVSEALADAGSDSSVRCTVAEIASEALNNEYIEGEEIINNSEYNSKSSDSEEYVEATESSSFDGEKVDEVGYEMKDIVIAERLCIKEILEENVVIQGINDRMYKAEEAVSNIANGNTKLEEGISVMENISQQNLKLSNILREIMLGITNHLEFIRQQLEKQEKRKMGEESDSSDEFEEAIEDLPVSVKSESDAETFYDIPPPSYCYLCFECGIKMSNASAADCNTCGRTLFEIPNGFLDKPRLCLNEDDSLYIGKTLDDLVTRTCGTTNGDVEGLVKAVFPVFVKSDFPRFSVTTFENRLKLIETETNMLKDNNEIVSLLIEDLQGKLSDELEVMRNVRPGEGCSKSSSETTIVGLDFSVYQVKRTITEMKRIKEPLQKNGQDECQKSRTFIEMKFEEVFKKEQQTALELQIFQQKLQVEGLIIKEKEDYFTCSDSSQVSEKVDEPKKLSVSLSRRYMSEKFQTVKGEIPSVNGDGKNEELLISIEIEVDRDTKGSEKKAIRCEYKANLQKSALNGLPHPRNTEYERILPTITLHPMWASKDTNRTGFDLNAECITSNNKKVKFEEADSSPNKNVRKFQEIILEETPDRNLSTDVPYFIDIESDDFVHIKSPAYFCGSSDEECDSCAGDATAEKRYRKSHSVAAVRMPVATYPVTEITLSQTPFAVLNNVNRTFRKREFGRISQIELEQSPTSGVVLLQTQAVSSIRVTESPSTMNLQPEGSYEEFFEATSQSITSLHTSARSSVDSLQRKKVKRPGRKSSCLIQFVPVCLGGTSVAHIRLPDEMLPVVVTGNAEPAITTSRKKFGRTSSSCCGLVPNQELTRALTLIREIENDVVEVKLDNAIAILPQLESILREHVQDRVKVLQKKSSTMTNSSVDIFMSTLNFLTEEVEFSPPKETIVMHEVESEERLGKMLKLLTGLEDAVRQINPMGDDTHCPETNAERIYDLLKDLSSRIKDAGNNLNVSQMEKTLELTSELDVAIRNYSSDRKREKLERDTSQEIADVKLEHRDDEGMILAERLTAMKKKIFEIVATEAQERESRIEMDFDRIARLEKENAEVMKFLDTLLDKTLIRVGELDDIRQLIYGMKETMNELMRKMELKEMEAKRVEKEPAQPRVVKVGRTPTLPSIQEVSSDNKTSESSEEERVKDTLSDMIVAVDNLKSKAKEKKEKYKEIFGEESRKQKPPKEKQSCYAPTETFEGVRSSITEFKRMGSSTFYMEWSKPVFTSGECNISGYEIWINGRVNQRVRNRERLKAVLYSVDSLSPGDKIKIKLFALTDDGRRRSLADLRYPEETGQ